MGVKGANDRLRSFAPFTPARTPHPNQQIGVCKRKSFSSKTAWSPNFLLRSLQKGMTSLEAPIASDHFAKYRPRYGINFGNHNEILGNAHKIINRTTSTPMNGIVPR